MTEIVTARKNKIKNNNKKRITTNFNTKPDIKQQLKVPVRRRSQLD